MSHVAGCLGSLAAVCTTSAFLPQAVKTLRERQTAGISLWTYVLFTVGVFLWMVYGILIGSVPVMVANGVTMLLAGAILGMKIRFG